MKKRKVIIIIIFAIIFIGIAVTPLFKETMAINIEDKDQDFEQISQYKYNIYDKTFESNGIKYKAVVAEDGVLLIYGKNTEDNSEEFTKLIASSKRRVLRDNSEDCIAHFGENDTYECKEENAFISRITEEKIGNITGNDGKAVLEENKYNIYAENTSYKGTDITGYNEELYNRYHNDFAEIIREIGIETAVMLDYKINGEYMQTGIKNVDGQTEINLPRGQYLVNCDSFRYTYYWNLELPLKTPGAYETKIKGATLGVDGYGIVIPSNVKLNLNGSVIKQIDDAYFNTSETERKKNNLSDGNGGNRYYIFRIEGGENITITNGTLLGDKAERPSTKGGENGHGIFFKLSENIKNISINNMIIKYMNGDGILINGLATEVNDNKSITGISIKNNYIYACNRQGISVGLVNDLTIQENTIYNINGTWPMDCIDVEPDPNYKKSPLETNSIQYTPLNYSNFSVDNIKIINNKFNNFTTVSLRYYVGDTIISDNEITGAVNLYNSDGQINFNNNKVYTKPNNAYQKNISSQSIVIGGTSKSRDDNNGLGYRTSGLGNKDCPEALLMYENEFYNNYFIWNKVAFADVAFNKFYKESDTGIYSRMRFQESEKSFKNVYIHDNNFATTRKNVYRKVTNFELNPILNIYNNTYKNNLTDNSDDNVLDVNLSINLNAATELSNILGNKEKVTYFKLDKISNQQVYWLGETDGYKTKVFNPVGMQIGAYKLKLQNGKAIVEKVGTLNMSQILTDVNKSYKVTINGEEFTIYIDNDDTDTDSINPNIVSNTTMARIVLEGTNKKYYVYQKIRALTAVKEGNIFVNGAKNIRNISYIASEKRSVYSTAAFNKFSIDNSTIKIGDDIKEKFNAYSVYYNLSPTDIIETSSYGYLDSGTLDNRHGYAKPAKVPEELVTWSIISPNGMKKTGSKATIIEIGDIDSNGIIKIQAEYIGITLDAEIEANLINLNKGSGTLAGTVSIVIKDNSSIISPSTITLAEKSYSISGFELDKSRNSDNANVTGITSLKSVAPLKGYYTAVTGGNKVLNANTVASLVSGVENYTDAKGNWIKRGQTTLYAQFGNMQQVVLPKITKEEYTCGWTTAENGMTIMYESGSTITPTDNIKLYGVCIKNTTPGTKLIDILRNNNYSVNNNYVLGITVGSSVSELKSKLGSDVTIESTKTIITTGTIIKKGNESYTVVIKGDINGDGKIGSLDYVAIRKHIMKDKIINSNSLEFMAADIYEDNEIKAMDYIKIRKIIMEM